MSAEINLAFGLLLALFVKHWYVDFVNQTDAEVKTKGSYGKCPGIYHSIKHGIATAVLVYLFAHWSWGVGVFEAIVIGNADALIHYHVDWWKMKFGNRNITTKAFWAQLGLDQLAHAATYLGIVWILLTYQ